MKKRFIAILAVLMSMLVGVTALTGCNLVTPNTDRDLEQVVATVQIDSEMTKEKIYKKDMIMGYLNYGYMYEQNYGYTRAQVFELILDNLVNNRLFVQHSMKEFENDADFVKDTQKDKYTLDRYLTQDEIIDAKYQTRKSINDLIDGYEEVIASTQDTVWETVRTVPTGATNKEIEVTDKAGYKIDKGIGASGEVNDTRYNAYAKVLRLLKNNGLLGKNVTDVEGSDYYNDVEKSFKESILVEKFEERLTKNFLTSEISFDILSAKYTEMYNDQQNNYDGDADAFATALSSATAQSPIFYNGAGGYGYVYNLLLGASTEQSTAITNYKTNNPNTTIADYNSARNDILKATTVKDLRSTWIQSGYDFDGTKFTGDYAFLDNSLPFKGSVINYDDVKEGDPKYGVESVETFDLDGFFTMMDSYLGNISGVKNNVATDPVYMTATASANIEDYEAKINELLFAFSTDSGSLNPYKGYVIAPQPDFDGKDQWVKEFADAGRTLINTLGANSYIVVASDYGYHILFYSEALSVGGNASLEGYLTETEGNKDWTAEYASMVENWFDEDKLDSDSYLYTLASANVSTKISKEQQSIIENYLYPSNGDKCVEKFEKTYSDLIGG